VLDRRPELREMLDLPSFTEVCKSFVDLYRVGLKVFDEDGTKLVDIKTGSGDFCAYMFTKVPGRVLCTETVNYVRHHPLPVVAHAMESRDCFSGCRYVMSPILHEHEPIGRVVFGPFVPDDLADLGQQLAALDGTFDLNEARELMGRIRKAPDQTVRRILEHFAKVVDVLVFTSYRSHLTSQLHVESITMSYRELQEKARQLEESNAHLQELDRLKSNFLATMSHELRTPLTSVIGYSEMLLSGLAGDMLPEQREYLATILEKGESLLGLISSILDFSKIEARGVSLSLRPTDIPHLLRTSVSTLLPQAQKKKIALTWQSDPMTIKPVLDEDRVRQCVVNLLSNAVKFTPEGGSVRARARLKRADGGSGAPDTLEITVQDDGVGIAPEQHERIFQTFYQVDSSSTREHGGTGLGLAIVRSYVEAHGGHVAVESALGSGATFALVFPLVEESPAVDAT
jgi:signal transduction histidine kinase